MKLIKELRDIVIGFYKALKNGQVPNGQSKQSSPDNPDKDNTDEDSEAPVNEYEKLLIIAEGENRTHIAVEQQMKMKIDDYEQKVNELEAINEQLNQKIENLEKDLHKYNTLEKTEKKESAEITKLKYDIGQTRTLLKSYEDQNLKMAELEKKLRNIHTKHDREIKLVEEKYKEKIKTYERTISQYKELHQISNQNKQRSISATHRESKDPTKDIDLSSNNIEEAKSDKVHQKLSHQTVLQNRTSSKEKISFRSTSAHKPEVKTNPCPFNSSRGHAKTNKLDQYKKLLDKKIEEDLRNKKSDFDDQKDQKSIYSPIRIEKNGGNDNLSKFAKERGISPAILKEMEKTLGTHNKGVLNSVENIDTIKKKLNDYRLNKMNNNMNYYSNNSNQNNKRISNKSSSKLNQFNNNSNSNNVYKTGETTLKQYIFNKINSKDFNTNTSTISKKKANMSRSHSIINN